MRRTISFLSLVALVVLSSLSCDNEKERVKEDEKQNEPQIETLSADKGTFMVATLSGRVSGLEGVTLNFECGIEYSTDSSFAEDKTIRKKAKNNYSEDPYTVTITITNSDQKYYYRAYCICQNINYYGEVKDFIFTWDVAQNGSENGYQYIELGLSVKWATFNVGASKPEEYGDYYMWGVTEPQSTYSWANYKWCNGSKKALTKYVDSDYYGEVDNKTILDANDDVAHIKWGGSWRMPTKTEIDELNDNCTWVWYGVDNTEFDGVAGYKVISNKTGYTDRFIFLPAAGGCIGYDTPYIDFEGYYWSSTLNTFYSDGAHLLNFSSDFHKTDDYYHRVGGYSVRPVCPNDYISLDSTNLTLLEGELYALKSKVVKGGVIVNNADVTWKSDKESVATVTADGTVTAISAGTATITASYENLSLTCVITVLGIENGIENGFQYVEMGLSVRWATINIGASKPEEYGDYFAWGETETKTIYNSSTYKWYEYLGDQLTITKYNWDGNYGIFDQKTILDPEDDVAHVRWGGRWRMPTVAEQNELLNNCTWRWTYVNDVIGYLVTSNKEGYTDRSIFLPAAGYCYGTGTTYGYGVGYNYCGFYWSSMLSAHSPRLADAIHFSYDHVEWDNEGYYGGGQEVWFGWNGGDRSSGYSVRAVCP